MNKDDLARTDSKGQKRTLAFCCTAVSIDLRKVFTSQQLSDNSGINWITVLLTQRNDNTLGVSVTGISSHCNASSVLFTVGQFLTESTKVAAENGLDVRTVNMEKNMMNRIRDDQVNKWFLQTGSPQAVKACVKLTLKHLKKLKPKPGCKSFVMGKILAYQERMSRDSTRLLHGRGPFKLGKQSSAFNVPQINAVANELFPEYVHGSTVCVSYPADTMAHNTPILISHYIGTTYFRQLVCETSRKGLLMRTILPPPGLLPGPVDVDEIRKSEKKMEKKMKKEKKKEKKKRKEEEIDFNSLSDSEKMVHTMNSVVEQSLHDPDPEMGPIPKAVAEGVIRQFHQSGLSYEEFMENIEDHHTHQASIYNKNLNVEKTIPIFQQMGMNKKQIEDVRTRYQGSELSELEDFMVMEWEQGYVVSQDESLEIKYSDESLGNEERLEALCLKLSLNGEEDDVGSKDLSRMIEKTKKSYYDSGLTFSEFLHSLRTSDDMYECLCGSGFASSSCSCNM